MNNSVVNLLNSIDFKRITTTDDDVFNFIHSINHKEHCILIFYNEHVKDKLVKEFFNTKFIRNAVSACFSRESSKFKCDHEITYDELTQNQMLLPSKISDFLVTVLDESYKRDFTRIACDDTTWFSEAGFFEEHQKCGNNLDDRVMNESVILCCYNATKLNEERLKVVLSSRKYIILEEPFAVYEKI